MSESKTQKDFCLLAKKRGWLTYKFVSPNNNGVPDLMVLGANGVIFFIEFKAKGKKASNLQKRMHEKFRQRGVKVFVCDNLVSAENALHTMEH